MESHQIAKILNILSFVILLIAVITIAFAKRNGWNSEWALYALLLAVLIRMLSFSVKNKALERENAELKEDLKNLTRILEDKITK